MKLFTSITVMLAVVQAVLAHERVPIVQADINFGLLICEHGPVIFRQSIVPGVSFKVFSPSKKQCKPLKVLCKRDFGFLQMHRGLDMCTMASHCERTAQVCLKKILGGEATVQGCCKPGFEAWALTGSQKTVGALHGPPVNLDKERKTVAKLKPAN